ncbi:MAG: nucleotidyl transferase AbiEii/AbiGii toxin family protein [Bacilli bacterium]
MNEIITQMLSKYEQKNLSDKKNAIKEVIQEIVLCALSRGGFFNEAVFYGGTALRIFYELDRFSEDLDFSLLKPNPNFDLSKYFIFIENEIKALGINFSLTEKVKTFDSNTKSAFLKSNTKECIITFYGITEDSINVNNEEAIKIKFEIDVNPPRYASFENKYGLLPSPYMVKIYDLSSLFAGKIHACLCRNWKSRVKGRDFYDYLFFITKDITVNLKLLKEKLVNSNFISDDYDLTIENLKLLLFKRFESIDFEQAKEDVFPFIKDKNKLDLWSKEFFIEVTKKLKGR